MAESRPHRDRVHRLALHQIAPVLGDVQRNLDRHLESLAEAAKAGATLSIFPELSLSGYFLRDLVPDVAVDQESEVWQALARSPGPPARVVGFAERSPEFRYYNTADFVEDGRLVQRHRKVFLPSYGLFEEQRYFAAGDRIRAFDSPRLGRVGVLICEDFWHLSALAIMQAEDVHLLICIANSPARGVAGPHTEAYETYRQMACTFARLLGAMVVVVNRVGFEDGLCFWGQSLAVGPDGRMLAEGPPFDETTVYVDFDLEELERARLAAPLARDERLLVTLEELNRIREARYGA